MLWRSQVKASYALRESFADWLPWLAYSDEHEMFLLDDRLSVGALWECTPIPCDGASEARLEALKGRITAVLQNAIPEDSYSPWVLQVYAQIEPGGGDLREQLSALPEGPLRAAERQMMDRHLDDLERPGGLFFDSAVTGERWGAARLRARLVLFRRWPLKTFEAADGSNPITELNTVRDGLEAALREAELGVARGTHRDLYEWLIPWFNPRGAACGSAQDLLAAIDPDLGLMPNDHPYADLTSGLFYSTPKADPAHNCYEFDNEPHRLLPIVQPSQMPVVGHVSRARRLGGRWTSLLTKWPSGSVVALSVVFAPQEHTALKLDRLQNAAFGAREDSRAQREEAEDAERAMAHGVKFYPCSMGVYLRAPDLERLERRHQEVAASLAGSGLQCVSSDDDPVQLNHYVQLLPMAYRPEWDQALLFRAPLYTAPMIARLMPVYGMSRGTGRAGFVFWNQQGEAVTLDPLHRADRRKNAHALTLGSTGSGKSGLMAGKLWRVMACHNARPFLIDAGNSFGLFTDFVERQGLRVHRVTLTEDSDFGLPPFAAAAHLPDVAELLANVPEPAEDYEPVENVSAAQLELMELIARVMITGGDPNEERHFRPHNRMDLRRAILAAGLKGRQRRESVTISHVKGALAELAQKETRDHRRERLEEMVDALELFCSGVADRLFNRPAQPWPEADLTIMELGLLSRDEFKYLMPVAFMSLMGHIYEVITREQYSGRPNVIAIDEAHNVTTNPLISPYLVRIVYMLRKYGTWLWLATLNLHSFPDEAKPMLGLMEWWYCLATDDHDEIDQISRFRDLSDEQSQQLYRATKLPGRYVEGTILGADGMTLPFRNVPPPELLALTMNELDEKAERQAIMRAQGIGELDAALQVAERIREARRG